MIIYSPIDLPKIQINDWNKFWEVWKLTAKQLVRVREIGYSNVPTGISSNWIGIDIFRKYNYMPVYYAPLIEVIEIDSLKEHFPTLNCVRIIQSTEDILSHTDDNNDDWKVRGMLHYTSNKSQWYFTKPEDRFGDRHYMKLPDNTMWFTYNDKYCWHGTDYDSEHPKLLIQLYFSEPLSNKLLQESFEKYKDYVIEF